jgi:tRNA A-37 threonylcarbamoyl transferase component Bud32
MVSSPAPSPAPSPGSSPGPHQVAGGAIVTVDTDRCTASVLAEHASALRDLLATGSPEDWAGFTAVKHSTVRTTRTGALGEVAVHVKLYRAVRFFDRARDLVRGARGEVEFHNLRRARERGLPAAEPLAFGVTKATPPRSFLITRTVRDAQPLPRGPLPEATAAAAGRLLRRVHDAGLDAFDLHAENVLCDARGALWLVDLTTARFAAGLDVAARARGLAFFTLELDGGPRHRAALPLLAAYAPSDAVRGKLAQTWRLLRVHGVDAFGRRATRACKHTSVERPSRGVEVFRHSAGDRANAALQKVLAPDFALDATSATKSGRRGGVWLHDEFVIKRRNRADATHLFRASYWLTYAGVAIAQPLALILRHDHGLVLSERLAAPDLAAEVASGALTPQSLREAAAHLGTAVGRLHGHGLRNRDLKFENLVRDPRTGAVCMVDLDGVRRKGSCDRRGQAADLGRLLAAFRAAHSPGGNDSLRAFGRSYTRARLCLGLSKIDRFTKRLIEVRASAWASASANTRTSRPG